MDEIRFFIREEPFGFLSNFERTPFEVNGVEYKTNEHFYQSQKVIDEFPMVKEWIKNAPHARLAMVIGRQLEHNKYLKKFMKPYWETVKVEWMLCGLRHKFENPVLREKLLDTGDAVLHENNPEDFFWGIGEGAGKSMLGKLLMQVRDEVRGLHRKVRK